jgi:SAM-dependent methyltransferase
MTFDATAINLSDSFADFIISVSVIEHIPGNGDTVALQEIRRILTNGGTAVISVPLWKEPLTETKGTGELYWEDFAGKHDNSIFFQRRYSFQELLHRLIAPSGLTLESICLIGEHPQCDRWGQFENGTLIENWHYLTTTRLSRFAKNANRVLPFLEQAVHTHYSEKYHYFSESNTDPNSLAAVLVLRKL